MRIAVVGCGSIGSRHARNASAMGHYIVAYDERGSYCAYGPLIDPSGPGVSCCASLAALVSCRPDAVLICTPAHTHAAVAKELLAAGYGGPLFIEKPLAMSVEEAQVFRDWPHPVAMIGYNWRFHSAMRSALSADAIRWLHFECDTNMRSWPGSARDGDPALECSHEIDLALSLGATFAHAGRGYEKAWFQFTNPSALVDLCWAADRAKRSLSIRADHALMSGEMPAGEYLDQSYVDELAHFLRAVESGPIAPGCTLEEGIAVLEVIEEARRMAA